MPLLKRHHFDKVLEWARKGRIAPLYLLVGDEEIGEELRRRLLATFRDLGHFVEEIDLNEVPFENLLSTLRSPALLGRKIISLKTAQQLPSEAVEEVLGVLESHRQNLSLVMVLSELVEKDPLSLFAREAGVLLSLPSRRSGDLLRYEIPEMLAAYGKKMDRTTAELLLSLVGEDLSFLRQEIEKLALYAGEASVITADQVRELVSPKPEEAPYTVLEVLFTRGAEEALNLSRELFARGTHPLVLVATFLTFFKRLWLLLELLEEYGLPETKYPAFRQWFLRVRKEFWSEKPPRVMAKIHPYALYRMLPVTKRFKKKDLPRIFSSLARLDGALKRGVPAEEAFYDFFLSLRALPAPNGPAKNRPFGAILRDL